MRTIWINLTTKQRDQIKEFRKKGGCTILQPVGLSERRAVLRCCSISRKEMKVINDRLKAIQA